MSQTLRELSSALLRGDHQRWNAALPLTPAFASERVGDRVVFVSSFANVTAFETDEGLLLVDTGSFLLAEPTRVLLRRATEKLAHSAVFTHGHVDHCFGVELYEKERGGPVHVVAHEAVSRRFARYRLTHGYNAIINGRQFGIDPTFPETFREPDETYRDRLDLSLGGRRFELHHALGETDDHTWVWAPNDGVLCTGDLFIWASPNCGNPQKVQRFPREWGEALRSMERLDAEVLCPGHGVPIFGRDAVRLALSETAELLEILVHDVLRLVNLGAPLDRVLAEVRAPERLLARPYLRPVYDDPEFIVRNLHRLYAGWWDGDPSHLRPARSDALSREIVSLAGGVDSVRARAEELLSRGDLALASHLVEHAFRVDPNPDVVALVRRVYEARVESETSLMAKGVFGAAAKRGATDR